MLKQIEIMAVVKHFVRFYEFLIQVSCFEDVDLHKKYLFLTYFKSFVNIKNPGGGFDLTGKIKASNFLQKKEDEHKREKLIANPIVKLPTADTFNLTEDKIKRLSEIIAEKLFDYYIVLRKDIERGNIFKLYNKELINIWQEK